MRRQAGGHDPANLITLCGSATSAGCHRLAEDRNSDAERRGLWIRANTNPPIDPGSVPVFYAHEQDWFLLHGDGTRTRCPAPEGAASVQEA